MATKLYTRFGKVTPKLDTPAPILMAKAPSAGWTMVLRSSTIAGHDSVETQAHWSVWMIDEETVIRTAAFTTLHWVSVTTTTHATALQSSWNGTLVVPPNAYLQFWVPIGSAIGTVSGWLFEWPVDFTPNTPTVTP